MHYKKTALVATVAIMSVSVFGNASAAMFGNRANNASKIKENNGGAAGQMRNRTQGNFCEKIGDLNGNIVDRISSRISDVDSRIRDREQNWEDNESQVDSKVEKFRSERDSNIEAHFKSLEDRATTDDQKKAVATFEETVRKAVETRRDAIDSARETFQSGVKDAIAARDKALEDAMMAFKDSVSAAVEKAKSDCSGSTSPQQIRTALRNSIQAAHEKFVSDRQLQKVGPQVEALAKTRNAAVQKAMTDFKAALLAATTELKKAFPDSNDISSSSSSISSESQAD